MGTFDVDEVVEKPDAVMIDQQVKFFFASGAGGEVALEKDLDIGLDGMDLVL